jgi:peptidoglycan hydrolase CwlO-like protein
MSFANIAGAIRNLISDFLVQANHVQVEQTDQIEQVDQADQNFVRQQQQLHVRLKDIADRYAHVGAKLR